MYHYDMYVKVAYDNFDNKRRCDDDDDICIVSLSHNHTQQTAPRACSVCIWRDDDDACDRQFALLLCQP